MSVYRILTKVSNYYSYERLPVTENQESHNFATCIIRLDDIHTETDFYNETKTSNEDTLNTLIYNISWPWD